MVKILVVDDEQRIREMIRKYAEYEGFAVDEACDGLEAVDKAMKENYDLIVMDIMMPNLDGFSACREIRKTHENVPVILLSALGEEYDKIHGFDLGVDDYVVKPFSPKELMARVKVILERFKTKDTEVLRFEGLQINIEGRSVTVDGEKANLTPKEIDLLLYMVKNKNIALSRMKLLEEVWDYDYFGDDRTVDTHIKMLRHNLKDYRKFIVTVRGRGYKFEA